MKDTLTYGDMSVGFHLPDGNGSHGGYYQGTRFDYGGIVSSLKYKGREYVEEWFDSYDPFRHDCLSGPAEEFSQQGYETAEPGGSFLKTGVGMLERSDNEEYDRFKLFRILNPGVWSVEYSGNLMEFTHVLSDGIYGYEYVKRFTVGSGTMRMSHILRNKGKAALKGSVYCHNFFTLGRRHTGPDTVIGLPFTPAGNWREKYGNVALTDSGIAFSRPLERGESVFMGDLHNASGNMHNLTFSLSDIGSGLSVQARLDKPCDHIVFWANDRIACIEPYILYDIAPGEYYEWEYEYSFN